MEDFNLLAPLLLAIVGLLAGAILKSILKRTGFPYTVGLFVFGLLIGLLNRFHYFDFMPRVENAVATVADTNPDFILYVFLPILIFDAAYEMNMHIFKKTLANSTLLAVPGLVVCMLLTAALMIGISLFAPEYTSWTWPLALMFGALISATDPVAVVALLHELGTSKRFSTLVDGESLLNDGTGIVCFMLFFGAYTLSGASTASPVVQFLEVVIGGILLGFCLARLTIWFITRINSEEMIPKQRHHPFCLRHVYPVPILYGHIRCHRFSGFRTDYLLYRPPQTETASQRIHGKVLGTSYPYSQYISLYHGRCGHRSEGRPELVRPHHFAACLRRAEPHPVCHDHAFLPRYEKIGIRTFQTRVRHSDMGWPARSIGMTLALMVSYTPGIPEDIRRQVLFLTAGIVTLTLSINATTMRWLLRRLGLIQVSSARVLIDSKIQGYLHDSAEKYMEKLSAKAALHDANWNKVKKYLPPSLSLSPSGSLPTMEFLSEIRLRILDREKAVCHQLYDEGVVSKTTFLHLMNSLDEMYDHDGQYALDYRPSIFNYCNRTSVLPRIQKKLHLGDSISFYFRERIVNAYDLARGFIILQNEDLNLLNELNASELLTPDQKKRLDILRTEINHNIDRMNHVTLQLEQNYPKAYRHALTVKSIRMMLTYERRTIRKLQDDGVISEKDAERFIEKVDERTDQGNSFRYSMPGTLLRGILHAISPKKR